MSTSPYNRQLLTCHAYGFIGATGASAAGFGCSMSRQTTGTYQLALDADSGLVEGQSFLLATPKASGARSISAQDSSNVLKTVFVFTDAGALVDTDVEVALFKSPLGVSG